MINNRAGDDRNLHDAKLTNVQLRQNCVDLSFYLPRIHFGGGEGVKNRASQEGTDSLSTSLSPLHDLFNKRWAHLCWVTARLHKCPPLALGEHANFTSTRASTAGSTTEVLCRMPRGFARPGLTKLTRASFVSDACRFR